MVTRAEDPAFFYFPENYRWSMAFSLTMTSSHWSGAEFDEGHRVMQKLKSCVGDDKAWFKEWSAMAAELERRGRDAEKAGHTLTAASYLMRAANYYQTGERFVVPKTAQSAEIYRRSVEIFKAGTELLPRPRIESVEIPYGDKSLPALFVHADPAVTGGKPAPTMVFLDGFDITKEISYFRGVPEFSDRGISCLIVDGPGNGEAVRFRDMPLIAETERYATAAYEYVAGRSDVDAKRVGIMAISLGGYYAPRAATFEPRFACCIAWGAHWDVHELWRKRFEALDSGNVPSLSVAEDHLTWIFNVKTRAEAMKILEDFRLDGIVQNMKCPFLLVHGENDEQVVLSIAETCFKAAGSKNKTLKVFGKEEGGWHHCQVDNTIICAQYMADWVADTLRAAS